MSRAATPTRARPSRPIGPTWDIAYLFPNQGHWSEADYLALETNHLIELCGGRLQVLPMPTTGHQAMVASFWRLLNEFVSARKLGTALFAALPVRLSEGTFREPDVLFMRSENASRITEDYWIGADLVVEVISKGRKGRDRDLRVKRKEYAEAGITEYWIVDPQEKEIVVLKLSGAGYEVHGRFEPGQRATSAMLPGFSVDVKEILAVG
jgi:Uma2 family endonuclease